MDSRSRIYQFSKFKVHMFEGYIQQTPILEYKDKILIMDGGCRSDVASIIDYIKNVMNRPLSDVKLVIASHIHPDHAGGVSLFKRLFHFDTAAPLGINSWYSGLLGGIQHKIDIALGHYVASAHNYPFKFMYYPRFVKSEYILRDNASVLFFEDWIVYSAEGHTNHDVIFYNHDENILYAADVVLKVKNKLMFPIPVSFPEKIRKSIKFIRSLGADKIFLAHGGCITGEDFAKEYEKLFDLAEKLEHTPPSGGVLYRLTRITPEVKKNV